MKRSAAIIQCPLPTRKDFKNLTGAVFGRLTVIRFYGTLRGGYSKYYTCRCQCLKEAIVGARHLISGSTTSCGCFKNERRFFRNRKHGLSRTPEYKSWAHLIARCYNPKVKQFKYYGGRGITVCERWRNSPANFFSDMGRKPSSEHTIERINNAGNYNPSNCKWATKFEQGKNKRNNRWLSWNGKTLHCAEWSRMFGFNNSVITGRLKRGWSIEEAVTTPLRKCKIG